MIKLIFIFCLFIVAPAQSAEQKVYSAAELQKIADGVFQELNIDGSTKVKKVELLISPQEAKRDETLNQIKKVISNNGVGDVKEIYNLVMQASQVSAPEPKLSIPAEPMSTSPSVETPSSLAPETTQPNIADKPSLPISDSPVVTLPVKTVAPSPDVSVSNRPRATNRLDAWLNQDKSNPAEKQPSLEAPSGL